MRLLTILFPLLVACGGSKSSPQTVSNTPPPTTEPTPAAEPATASDDASCAEDPATMKTIECAVRTMDRFARLMCECKDQACAEKTNEDLTKWGTEMAKNVKEGDPKPSVEQVQQIQDASNRYSECLKKLSSSS